MKTKLIAALTVVMLLFIAAGSTALADDEFRRGIYCDVCKEFREVTLIGYVKATGDAYRPYEQYHFALVRCTVCGYETRVGSFYPHTETTPATCTSPAYCADCGSYYGEPDPDAHAWGAWEIYDENTHRRVCSICEKEEIVRHTESTPATCIAPAYCDVCQSTYGEPDPDAHAWGEWEKYDEDTHSRVCSDCEKEEIVRHTETIAATCQTAAYCADCDSYYGEPDPDAHDLVHHDAQAPTCTEIGREAYDTCTRCDYTTYKEIPALDHDLVSHDAQAPTCTEIGWEAYDTCSRCDYTTYKEIPALGHDLVHHEAKAATAAEEGNIEYWFCDGCGKYFSDEAGTNEIEEADTILPKLAPSIIAGDGATVTQGEKEALSFTSDAAFDDFIRVEVDGETLGEENYTAEAGSIIVTLNADYIATLSVGEHTLGVVSQSGTAAAKFTVNARPAVTEPAVTEPTKKILQTGDDSSMTLWASLLLASALGLTGAALYGKRKKHAK